MPSSAYIHANGAAASSGEEELDKTRSYIHANPAVITIMAFVLNYFGSLPTQFPLDLHYTHRPPLYLHTYPYIPTYSFQSLVGS